MHIIKTLDGFNLSAQFISWDKSAHCKEYLKKITFTFQLYCMAFWQIISNSVSCMHFMCTCSEYMKGLLTEMKIFLSTEIKVFQT